MQNPPAPEPSSPVPNGGYDAYPSAPSAGAPTQPYGQPPVYGAPPAPAYGVPPQVPAYTQPQGDGFFKALFDMSFSRYITLSFAKFIYIAFIALCALGWLFMVIAGFSQDASVGIMAFLFGWIPALVYIILIRLGLEASVALIRTARNTSELVEQARR